MGVPVIEVDGTEARVETSAIACLLNVQPGGDVEAGVRVRGLSYRDHFVERDRRWLIDHRVHRVDWMFVGAAVPPSIGRLAGER